MSELSCEDLPGGGLLLRLPVGHPIPKGNSKRIAATREGRPFLVSSSGERAHERAVRDAAQIAAGDRRVPGDVTLDLVSLYPVPEISTEHDAAWRARALAGLEAPGLGAHVGRRRCADRGNLCKLVEDALSPRRVKRGVARALRGSVIDDDACIVDGDVAKAWTAPDAAGYIVRIRPWRPHPRWWVPGEEATQWLAAPTSMPAIGPSWPADRLASPLVCEPACNCGRTPASIAARPGTIDVGERAAVHGLGGSIISAERRLTVETPRGRMDDATASLVRLGWTPDGPAGRTVETERARFRRAT